MVSKEYSNQTYDPSKLSIHSLDFEEYGTIPEKFFKFEDQEVPRFSIKQVGSEVKQLAFVMVDEDAPGESMIHWISWGIPRDTTELNRESMKMGTVGKNSWLDYEFHGPTPLKQRHHYSYTVYSLPDLALNPEDDAKDNLLEIRNQALERYTVLGYVDSVEDFAIE